MSGGAAGFGFLDADNWLEPGHIAACLDTANGAVGETPPSGAKPNPPWAEIDAWSAALTPAERSAVRKLCGPEP